MDTGTTRLPAWLRAAVMSGAVAWAGVGCSEDEKTDAADATVDDTPSPENPPICDADCPVVENARGSKTRTLVLKAKGEVRNFTVDGAEVAVHVSTYNGKLPGPTVEIETTASDPDAPTNSDVLMIDLTNEGGLNGCCYHQCTTPRDPESCWESHCKGTGLHQGDPCVQVDTPTNIHTHGLHTAAATTAGGAGDACALTTTDPKDPRLPWDNVFISIPPSGEAEHESCAGGTSC